MLGPREKIQRKCRSVSFQGRDTVPSQVPGLFSDHRCFYFNLTSSQAKKPCLLVGCSISSKAESLEWTWCCPITQRSTEQYLEIFLVFPVSGVGEMPLTSSGQPGCKSPSAAQDRPHITIKKSSVQTGNRFLPQDAFAKGLRLSNFIFSEYATAFVHFVLSKKSVENQPYIRSLRPRKQETERTRTFFHTLLVASWYISQDPFLSPSKPRKLLPRKTKRSAPTIDSKRILFIFPSVP